GCAGPSEPRRPGGDAGAADDPRAPDGARAGLRLVFRDQPRRGRTWPWRGWDETGRHRRCHATSRQVAGIMPQADRERDLRSYGRGRGRKLSPRRAALMEPALPPIAIPLSQPAPAEPGELFAAAVREVWLEIGFGGGEHLIWQARANPRVGIIGCEPFQDGLAK